MSVSKIVTAEMELNWARTLELETVSSHKFVDNGSGVLCGDSEVIHIYDHILVVVAVGSHPNVFLSTGWLETHLTENVG
jgi:hypothetical protein